MRHVDPLAYWERACAQRAEGDLLGALSTLDKGLTAAGLRDGTDLELSLLLHTKAEILGGQLDRDNEALVLHHRVLEVAAGKKDDDRLRLVETFSRVAMALVLGKRGQHAEAEEVLRNVASSVGSDEDPYIRAVAASALAHRVGQLLKLGDFEGARTGWESLRSLYCDDLDPAVRAEVAFGGSTAALELLERRHTTASLATADEVIALYRSETDAHIRAAVAVALWARVAALRRRGRLLRARRGVHDLARFLGSDPEPEVVEAISVVTRNYEEARRLARGGKHHGG